MSRLGTIGYRMPLRNRTTELLVTPMPWRSWVRSAVGRTWFDEREREVVVLDRTAYLTYQQDHKLFRQAHPGSEWASSRGLSGSAAAQ